MATLVWRWLCQGLEMLGIWNKQGNIVFMGLDNAGKTTLLHMLRDDVLVQHMPTQKPTMEQLQIGQVTLNAYDLGGHAIARRTWRDYTQTASGIVFLVDASDRGRLLEAKTELDGLLTDEALARTPIVVLGTKIDIPGACSEDELRVALGIYNTYGKSVDQRATMTGVRPIEVFMCSITRRQGYKEAFQWIARFIDSM